jgi:hypothetical protein
MRIIAAALVSTLLVACNPARPSAESVPVSKKPGGNGTLFVGGTVVAGANQTPQKDYAVYVTEGLIREVGPAAELRGKHADATVVDASNATILPGLTDAHGHLYGLGMSLDTVDLVGTTSFDDVIARVRPRAASAKPGEWVLGRGWDQNDWPVKEFPTAAQLDAAFPNNPVWLERVDGHASVANTAALRAADLLGEVKVPEGGKVFFDEATGTPTGVFVDAAQSLVERAVPRATFAQVKARVLASAQQIAKNGLTEMHDAGADDETIRAIRELVDEGKFPIRVYVMLSDNDQLLADWFKKGPLMNHGGRLTVRAVKAYADGALGSRGAALLAPYNDDPGNTG